MPSKKILKSLGSAAKMCRKVTIAANTCILTVATFLAVAGLVLRFGQSFIGPHITSLVQDLSDMADSEVLNTIEVSQFDFGRILAGTTNMLLLLAVVTAIVSGLGMFGAKQNIISVTVLYCVLLTLWIVFEISGTVIIFVKRDLLDNLVRPSLVTDIQHDYQGFNGTNTVSQTWNLIMVAFSCCGTSNYEDFEGCESWNRNYFQDGWLFKLQTPLPCCVFAEKAVDDFSCAVNPKPATSNYLKGCYEEIWGIIDNYKTLISIFICVILLFQLMLLCCSAFLAWSIRGVQKKDKKLGDRSTSKSRGRGNEYPEESQSMNDARHPHRDDYGVHRHPGAHNTTHFPGFANHLYSTSTLDMLKNSGGDYIAQLMAATLFQQQLANYIGRPSSMFNPDNWHRNSAPPDISRHYGTPFCRRGSQDLAMSLFTYPPPYDPSVNQGLLAIDNQCARIDESPSWPLIRIGDRGVTGGSTDNINRCRDCSNAGNTIYSSRTPEIREVSNDEHHSDAAACDQRAQSRSATLQGCRTEHYVDSTTATVSPSAETPDTYSGHACNALNRQASARIYKSDVQKKPLQQKDLSRCDSCPVLRTSGRRRNSSTQTKENMLRE